MQCLQIIKHEPMIILKPYMIQFPDLVLNNNNKQVKKIYAISNRSYAIFENYVIEWGQLIFKHNSQQHNQENIKFNNQENIKLNNYQNIQENNYQNIQENNQSISKITQFKSSFAIIPIKVNSLALGTKHTFAYTINYLQSNQFNRLNYLNQYHNLNQSNKLNKSNNPNKSNKSNTQKFIENNHQSQNYIKSNKFNSQQDNKSSVYCWGYNNNYQLGLQHQKLYGLIKVDLFDQALQAGLTLNQITCGQNHTLALFQDQQSTETKLFGWGQSKSYQLALDTTSIVPYPVDIQYQFTSSINKIYSKSDYNIAITNNNQLYAWGSNMFNRLGLNPPKKQTNIKSQLMIKKQLTNKLKPQININQVSINQPNTSRQVINLSKDSINQEDISFIQRKSIIGQHSINNIQKVKIPKQIQIKNQKIKSIALGTYHVIALTLQGQCFTWGNGIYGQLGNNKFGQFTPQQISTKHLPTGIKFISCAAGEQHSCLLDEQGNVYTCGSNSYGVLGHQKHENQSKKKRCKIFQRIQYFEQNKIRIQSISSGDRHILVQSQDGQVYGWGYNKNNEVILKINEDYNDKQVLEIGQVEEQNNKDSKLYEQKKGICDNIEVGLNNRKQKQVKSDISIKNNKVVQNRQQIKLEQKNNELKNIIRNQKINMNSSKQQQISNLLIQGSNNNGKVIKEDRLREWRDRYNDFLMNKRRQQEQLMNELDIILNDKQK